MWGAATRCALAAGDGYRVFTSHFVNVSSNTFCCGIMGLMAWGGYAESRYGSGVFLMITLLAMSGGCLLASSLMKSTDIVCGMNACNAAYANLTLLDTYFDKCIRARLKKAVTGLVAMFTIYAIVSGTFAGFLLLLGGALSSLLPVYLVQDSFAGEKADVIICATSATFTTVYFVTFISTLHALGCK